MRLERCLPVHLHMCLALIASLPSLAATAEDDEQRPVAVQEKKAGGLGFVMTTKKKEAFADFCKEMGVALPPKVGETTYVVHDFFPNGHAKEAGMKKNDVVFKIAGVEITGTEQWNRARTKVFAEQPVDVVVRRVKQAGKTKKWETVRLEVTPIDREVVNAAMDEREKSIPPIIVTASGIHYNVIGLPELTIAIQNTRQVAVEAFEVDVECFDKFDEPVNTPGKDNKFKGISQSKLEPKGKTRATWQLSLQRNTTQAKLWVSRVKLADGTIWTQTREEAESTDGLAPARLIE